MASSAGGKSLSMVARSRKASMNVRPLSCGKESRNESAGRRTLESPSEPSALGRCKQRRHTTYARPNENDIKFKEQLRIADHHGVPSKFDQVIGSEIDLNRSSSMSLKEIPEMSDEMREALRDSSDEQLPAWMSEAVNRSNSSSDDSDEFNDHKNRSYRTKRSPHASDMDKHQDEGYSDTTMKLLQRSKKLSKSIQYRKPINKQQPGTRTSAVCAN